MNVLALVRNAVATRPEPTDAKVRIDGFQFLISAEPTDDGYEWSTTAPRRTATPAKPDSTGTAKTLSEALGAAMIEAAAFAAIRQTRRQI